LFAMPSWPIRGVCGLDQRRFRGFGVALRLLRGIRFAPASGRQYASLRRTFAPWKDELIFIVLRGWTKLFGCINMELFGHYVGSVENGSAFLDELAHRSFKELQDQTGP